MKSHYRSDLQLMGYHFGLWMLSDYDHTWEEERQINGKLPDIYTNGDPGGGDQSL